MADTPENPHTGENYIAPLEQLGVQDWADEIIYRLGNPRWGDGMRFFDADWENEQTGETLNLQRSGTGRNIAYSLTVYEQFQPDNATRLFFDANAHRIALCDDAWQVISPKHAPSELEALMLGHLQSAPVQPDPAKAIAKTYREFWTQVCA